MSGSSAGEGTIGIIDDARRLLRMTPESVYLGYFAAGGNYSAQDVRAWLEGRQAMPISEYNRLAQAVNDEDAGRGLNHPVPYSDST